MPVHRCGNSALCLHDLGGVEADEAGDFEYVEIDPTGRYGRYKEVLGRGAFKTVYRAFDQEDGIEVAWNQVQDVLLQTQEDLDRLYSEVHLLSTLKHKNIIKLHHSWVDKKANTVNFITEIFTSGTLRQYRKRHKHIDIKAVKNWSRQILRGLLHLHSHDPPIIHRDLKCDNIFINGNQGEVKIGDLGLAAILQHAHARSVIGTPEFMAPELYEEEYTELVDVYSFGMCLLEMATCQYPYRECSNAAQIYKKVMQGKKPEALKQVKDPDLCDFIEKCLAPASKRLPARELLMDPFLQCEGSQSSIEPSSHVGRMVRRANDIDDVSVISEEPLAISATVQISYVLKETLPAYVHEGSEVCGCTAGDLKATLNGDLKVAQSAEPSLLHQKEDRARSVDFRVNGKRREDDNVFLKLRIAGSEGQVRNIHFPFDVESDTAMCVASEMVAELDLTDQDVTKIAEMIDAAILALVPEWKPGVAIDETCCEGELFDSEGGDGIGGVFDPVANILSEGLLEDIVPGSPRAEILSPSRIEGLVYGRFEEVTYQCHRSEFPAYEVEQCTISSDTSDASKEAEGLLEDIAPRSPRGAAEMVSPSSIEGLVFGRFEEVAYQCHRSEFPAHEVEQCTVFSDTSDQADWSSSDSSSSHTSQMLLPTNEAVVPIFEQCTSLTDFRDSKEGSLHAATAFNELVEFKRKSGCANFVHKILEGLVHSHSCDEISTSLTLERNTSEALEKLLVPFDNVQDLQKPLQEDCPQHTEKGDSSSRLPVASWDKEEDDECDDEAAKELAELALRHEQERLELQEKQEAARAEVRNRCQQRRKMKYNDSVDSVHKPDGNLMGPKESVKMEESSCETQRIAPYEYGSLSGSMTSFDDLSSMGQETPRSSSKAGEWQEARFSREISPLSICDAVYFPLTGIEGRG